MDISNLGEHIRALRISKGLKQREVAQKLKIGRSAYAMYEVGVRSLPLDKAMLLAEIYNLTVDELLAGPGSTPDLYKTISEKLSIIRSSEEQDQADLKAYCKKLEEENIALKDELLRMYRKQNELMAEIDALKRNENS